jgi:hypothetical protein
LFHIDVELSVPSVTINPNLDDVQSAINACALQIIKCTQQIVTWQSTIVFDGDEKHANKANHLSAVDSNTKLYVQWSTGKTWYARATNDMEMVKNVIILTGSVQTLRNKVCTLMLFGGALKQCNNFLLIRLAPFLILSFVMKISGSRTRKLLFLNSKKERHCCQIFKPKFRTTTSWETKLRTFFLLAMSVV